MGRVGGGDAPLRGKNGGLCPLHKKRANNSRDPCFTKDREVTHDERRQKTEERRGGEKKKKKTSGRGWVGRSPRGLAVVGIAGKGGSTERLFQLGKTRGTHGLSNTKRGKVSTSVDRENRGFGLIARPSLEKEGERARKNG